MTQRQRSAIIHYWLSKNWFDLGSASMRRLARRPFVLVMVAVFAASSAQAAEKLVSKGTKPVNMLQQERSDNLKAAAAKAVKRTFPKEAKQTMKTVTGTVVSVRKYAISVQVGESEENGAEEILIRLDGDVKFKGVKKAADFKYGDLVKVSYKRTELPAKTKGGDPEILDMTASVIELVKTAAEMAPPLLQVVEPAAAAQGVPSAK